MILQLPNITTRVTKFQAINSPNYVILNTKLVSEACTFVIQSIISFITFGEETECCCAPREGFYSRMVVFSIHIMGKRIREEKNDEEQKKNYFLLNASTKNI